MGSIPDTEEIKYYNKVSHNLCGSVGSCLPFVKNATSVKCNKVKHDEVRFACASYNLTLLLILLFILNAYLHLFGILLLCLFLKTARCSETSKILPFL